VCVCVHQSHDATGEGWGAPAVTFGNNLLAALPPAWTDRGRSRKWRLLTRLAAAVPPLLLGAFIYELSIVISVTGLFGTCRTVTSRTPPHGTDTTAACGAAPGTFIAFIFPAILQHVSRKRCVVGVWV
jgi:hypothetical protein